MPVSYIDVPAGLPAESKRKLVKGVFEAIHEAYPIPDNRILLREHRLENVSQDGRLDSTTLRPVCFLEVPPGLPIERKQKLVRRISNAIVEACRLPKEEMPLPSGTVVSTHWVLTFIREYPLEQVALDELLANENPMVLESLAAAKGR